ncbi:hypothetical protein NDN08_007365 [Rhodosorus marinus]|uniref:AMP-dependent synthetase/ligase domain-containing protein n=1 Tax=Rhodosorus marinus TaxID=101924 RepID=A0AAV8UGB5_9RHOD|nr:hypothetical protein NDN08_007365 [Rhodosorus marinus]
MINALEDTRPIALVYDPVYEGIVDAIRSKYGHRIEVVRADTATYPEQGSGGSIETKANGSQTPCGIFFTSGTTGRSKGAIISNESFFVQGAAKLEHVGYNINTVYLHLVPLFHVGGASSAVAVLIAGGTHIVDDSHAFSAARVMRLINKFKVTAFAAVPTMLGNIVDKAFNTSAKVSSFDTVSKILVGGGALDPQLKTQVLSVFPAAAIIVAYGMTETASSITFADVTARDRDDSGDVGRPPSHVRLSIVYGNESRNQDQGSTGEIATKGPHVMQGYMGRPRESQGVLQDGWFLTGDLGLISDSGSLILRGRKKDMIKTAGENVYAVEVERELAEHPIVAECAVLGLPHARYGEIVCAAVVLRSGARTGWEEELRSFLRERLSHYKEVVYDAADHREFVTGFKRRKDERRRRAEDELAEQARKDRIEKRKEKRQLFKKMRQARGIHDFADDDRRSEEGSREKDNLATDERMYENHEGGKVRVTVEQMESSIAPRIPMERAQKKESDVKPDVRKTVKKGRQGLAKGKHSSTRGRKSSKQGQRAKKR